MSPVSQRLQHFYRRAAATSVLVAMCPDQRGALTPVVLHWGADLGELDDDDVGALVEACTLRIPNSALDAPRWLGILPETATGFTGTPAVEILRAEPAPAWAPRFRDWKMADGETGEGSRFTAADEESGVEVAVLLELTDEGLVRMQSTLVNSGPDDVVVSSLRSVLPVGAEAVEVLDLTGRWTRERAPQRSPFRQGTWARSGRHGRTGHDATLLMVAGSPAFTFRRPVVLNTWEAVYFDHDLDRLIDGWPSGAAEVGVERFVLDDGWFRGRRDDTAGLGDWYVDEDVWPDGLHPLVDRVRALGMEFGLWVEPEMVNPDSDLARAHPDWILGRGGRPPEPVAPPAGARPRQPRAYAYLLERLDALLDEYDIAYLKWDHNRDLVDVGHAGRPARARADLASTGCSTSCARRTPAWRSSPARPAARGSTSASSSAPTGSGPATPSTRSSASRSSAGPAAAAARADRRHVGSPALAHHRPHPRPVVPRRDRAVRPLRHRVGHPRATAAERSALAEWIGLYKEVRELVATGTLVRGEHPDPAILVTGVVAPDLSEAVYVVATVATTATQSPLPVRLPGLDADSRYVVTDIGIPDPDLDDADHRPRAAGLTLSGGVLTRAGIQLPPQLPDSARVLHCRLAREDRR
jgi:alpha-galactosidase